MIYTSHQQVFDAVVTHLLQQGKKAVDDVGNCKYRAPDGSKCAAGALIPDDEYETHFESVGIKSLIYGADMPGQIYLPRWTTATATSLAPFTALLAELQFVHDNTDVADWPHEFRRVAARCALNTEVLNDK